MSVEEVDSEVLQEIFSNFFDKEEYGDFQVADRNFRFVDPDKFLSENENKNTKKKTESDMRLFMSFLMSRNETRSPEFIPPDQLNTLLCEFILGVTKKDGTEYEPCTIRGFVGSIDRHLKAIGSKTSIFKDPEFYKARAVLSKKQQDLKRQCLGNKPRTAEPLDDTIIDKMHEVGTLGDTNPRALIHSLWLICTTHFGMRTGKECHDLCWGDVQLGIDESTGDEYIVYDKERQTKTRSGSNPRDTRMVKPKAFSTHNMERDPVHLYKLYREKRPEELNHPDSPFFLTPAGPPYKCWYKKTPMGMNKLYSIMADMKNDADIQNARITPYSSRKRLVQKLQDEGVPPNQIVQVTGHKNVNSINNYSRLNHGQSRKISNLLSNKKNETETLALEVQENAVAACSAAKCLKHSQPSSGLFSRNLFANSTFNGPVTFNFNSSSVSKTQTLSQVSTVNMSNN